LGTHYSDVEIEQYLKLKNIPFIAFQNTSELCEKVAELLTQEKVVGWFQGRMEFGPRALGNRSILGDARSSEMQKKMNLKIKYRESFRPFAPAVLYEYASEWFDLPCESPYMLLVADIVKEKQRMMTDRERQLWGIDQLNIVRSNIPAVTHIDYSARIQTVHRETNPLFHQLLTRFYEKTGCPVVVNTSFNVRGEPIVESPKDAYTCFMRTDMDLLVIGKFLLMKQDQPALVDDGNWRKEYALD
jgi:carbamoyltransferase